MTLKDYLKVFGEAEIIDLINHKIHSLDADIEWLTYKINHNKNPKLFTEFCDKHNIPLEDRIIYRDAWLKSTVEPYELRLKKFMKEYRNILPIWRVLNNEKPSSKEEEFEEQIQQARNVPIESLYSGSLRKSSKKLMGKCPFHEEHSPSFFIFDDNHFKCFGCGVSGDSIEFYMKSHDVTFKEAVRALV